MPSFQGRIRPAVDQGLHQDLFDRSCSARGVGRRGGRRRGHPVPDLLWLTHPTSHWAGNGVAMDSPRDLPGSARAHMILLGAVAADAFWQVIRLTLGACLLAIYV